jgi:hypothetical protein
MSWVITGRTVNSPLLDAYSGAAAAYSLRQLQSGSYPVIRVRRSSDNTESDFTAAQVTDGTLTTFCGAGNGFVRTWYDQSGNGNHAETTVTTRQPLIVSSGAVVTDAGKPAVSFNGTSHYLTQTVNTTIAQPFTTIFAAQKLSNLVRNQDYFRAPHNGAVLFVNFLDNDRLYLFAGASVNLGSIGNGANFISSVVWNGASTAAIYNGTQTTINAGLGGLTSANKLNIATGGVDAGSKQAHMLLKEFIVYASNQSTNLTAINNNVNAHYAVY